MCRNDMGNHKSILCRPNHEVAPSLRPTPTPIELPDGAIEYEVFRGDTVVQIAHRRDVPTCNVVTTDGELPDPYKLYPGQQLVILPRSKYPPTTHKVVAGECLRAIASQYVSMQKYMTAIEDANPDVDFDKLCPGQSIRLPSIFRET